MKWRCLVSSLLVGAAMAISACAGLSHGIRKDGGSTPNVYVGMVPAVTGNPEYRFGYYPLEAGSVWTYRHSYRSVIGATSEVITITWYTEERVVETVTVPEGQMVLRTCTVRDLVYDYPRRVKEGDIGWFKDNIGKSGICHYLVLGSRYIVEVPEWGWDASGRTLTERFRGCLARSDNLDRDPDLASLVNGGLPHSSDGHYVWIVDGVDRVSTPAGHFGDCLHLVFPASNGLLHRWFKDGIGFVKSSFRHGGSYYEEEAVLVNFRRGKAPG